MSYTLVSAPVLGFELAQLPSGDLVAETLLTGLNADTTTLLALASRTRNPSPVPVEVAHLRSLSMSMSPSSSSSTATVDELVTLMGACRWDDAAAMDRLVRHEVLGAGCAALAPLPPATRERIADVLADAALAGWADPGPRRADRPSRPDLGGRVPQVGGVLAPLLDGDPASAQQWRAATPSDPGAWAQAMHQACWAAYLTDRVRDAATAQMMGVIAFRRAGLEPADAATGAWNALSGVLQACVVADLLDRESLGVLMAPAPCGPPPSVPTRTAP